MLKAVTNMRALYCLSLLFVLQLMVATLCKGEIVIRQSRSNATRTEGSWVVTEIATVAHSEAFTFYCTTEGSNRQSATLQWEALNGFTSLYQQTVEGGKLLVFRSIQRSQIGNYRCRDTQTGDEARLLLTEEDPFLLTTQSTVTVERGQQANLVIYWSSLGEVASLAIRWYKNGGESPIASFEDGATTSDILFDSGKRLTINIADMSDAGTYNITGTRYTSGFPSSYQVFITLIVYTRPEVVTQPITSLTVDEWSMVQLECRYRGDPLPQVTWMSDTGTIKGVIMSNMTEDMVTSRLTFNTISVADAGRYWCNGHSDVASVDVTTDPATISVTPRLLLFQSNGAIIEDSRLIVQPSRSVTLLCRASGMPRWYTANQLVSMGSTDQVYQDKVNSTTQQLHIRSYADLLSVEYTCVSGGLRHSVTLTTENPSVSSDNDTILYATPGSMVRLVVYVFGIPNPRADQILWYRNDTLITHSPPFTLSHNHLSLTISNMGTQYYGVYKCNVTTDNGTSSYNFTIRRPFPPSAEIEGPTEDIVSGSLVRFRCHVTQGTEPITIDWHYQNQPKLPDGAVKDNDILTFADVQPRHSGIYICNVTNPWGLIELAATLSVQEHPNVSAWIQSGTMNTSNSLNLTSGADAPVLICVATGNPLPEVRWTYRGGDDLPNGITVDSTANRAMLMWNRPVNHTDTGLYQCVGTNSVGEDVHTVSLTVTVAPTPPPTELLIQLRILSLSCSLWNVSDKLEQFTLEQIHTAIIGSLESHCGCQLNDYSLISDALSCSRVVDGSTLYKAGLTSAGDHNASDVLNIITEWMKYEPYITLNNTRYMIDTNCEVLVEPDDQSECTPPGNGNISNSSDDESDKLLMYGLVGLCVVVAILVLLIIGILLLLWRRHRNASLNFSRTLGKSIRDSPYISNSFQALNQMEQTDCQQPHAGNSRTEEGPHHYESIHAYNPMFKHSSNRNRVEQPDQSPRLSSDSRVTTDSGIQSSVHSCDRLTAQTSRSDFAPSQVSTHRPLCHANSEEIRLTPIHDDDSSEFSNHRGPMKRRQPSFDEVRYLSGVTMIDDEKHISHSQPLEVMDYPNHRYVFSEQRGSYSQSSQLSQSYPSASHLQQSKQTPEPYVEPVSLRGSLHSILGQSSQLDTMV